MSMQQHGPGLVPLPGQPQTYQPAPAEWDQSVQAAQAAQAATTPPTATSSDDAILNWLNARLGDMGVGSLSGTAPSANYVTSPAQLLSTWATAGIDIADPDVQALASDTATLLLYNDAKLQGEATNLTIELAAKYHTAGTAVPDYTQAMLAYGFGPMPTGPSMTGKPESRTFSLGGVTLGANIPTVGPKPPYETSASGAIRYPNGVIVNPATGEGPFYPVGDASVPGSPWWLAAARTGWSPQETAAQTQQMVDAGYLPKEALKQKTTFTRALDTALASYYKAHYINFGQDEPLGPGDPNYQGSTSTFQNLRKVRETLGEDVKAQYQRIFGVDPTAPELQDWTRWAISFGNKIQRSRDLEPSAAAQVAVSRAGMQMQDTGAGRMAARQTENTSLQDAILASLSASRSVMGL